MDDCVGTLDACGVCDGPGAIYACGCSGIPEGDCDCDGHQLDALGECDGPCATDADDNGVCDDAESTDDTADESADDTTDDTVTDSDGDGVADADDLCPGEPDDCSCYKAKDKPKKYIEEQCCKTSPASCD